MRAALLLILPALLCAQAPRELNIITGRGELLQFERDIERLAISEPKIADAVLVSPREIMVNGHTPGKASLVVWNGGSAPERYNVDVLVDNSEAEKSHKDLQAALPAGVVVGGSGETIVLTGTVKDATEVKRIEGGAVPGEESSEPVADPASTGATADSVAGEICQHQSRRSSADRFQPVQPEYHGNR